MNIVACAPTVCRTWRVSDTKVDFMTCVFPIFWWQCLNISSSVFNITVYLFYLSWHSLIFSDSLCFSSCWMYVIAFLQFHLWSCNKMLISKCGQWSDHRKRKTIRIFRCSASPPLTDVSWLTSVEIQRYSTRLQSTIRWSERHGRLFHFPSCLFAFLSVLSVTAKALRPGSPHWVTCCGVALLRTLERDVRRVFYILWLAW